MAGGVYGRNLAWGKLADPMLLFGGGGGGEGRLAVRNDGLFGCLGHGRAFG